MTSPRRPRGHVAVAMKRESSIESSVSQPRTRVTKKLKTAPSPASATVHLFIPHVPEAHKLVVDAVPAVSQPKRNRNGHFKTEAGSPAEPLSDSSDGGASSGDDADDEVDSQYRASDVDESAGETTDLDEDDGEAGYVEMSIVEHVEPSSPTPSLPNTPSSVPTSHMFPRFSSSPSSTTRAPPESPLLQVEDMLSSMRDGTRWISSSSDGSGTEREGASPRSRKRARVVVRGGDAFGVEDLTHVVPEDETMTPDVDLGQPTPQQVLERGQRILMATVSGVTAGLQALTPLNRALKEHLSDVEMRSFVMTDTDGYETDATMQASVDPDQDMLVIDNDPYMTLDQFTAYRTLRISTTGNARQSHPLVQTCRLRGQNIQDYATMLGYTLPLPLVRSLARRKRTLPSPHTRRHKPITELTGNLRADLIVRGLAKYRRDAIQIYNRTMGISVQEAGRRLKTWLYMDSIHGFSPESAVVAVVEEAFESPETFEATEPISSESRALVLYRGDTHANEGKPFVRTYSERVESHESLYPEAAARYTRALLSMLQDRFPAWDRWWSDERRFAARRHLWASYDAETARLELEAREEQERLAQRRRMDRRTGRLERLRIAAVPASEGMSTRMDREEQDLIEQAQLEARIQQFRALVYAPPVQLPVVVTVPDVRDDAAVPSSPPPAYYSRALALRIPSRRSASASRFTAGSVDSRDADSVVVVPESPPRLPAYQPNTYRRGISPPPPPPFNARTDAIPVPNLSRALEPSPSGWSVGRSLTFDSDDGAAESSGQANSRPLSSIAQIEAPVAIRSHNYHAVLSSAIPARQEIENEGNASEEEEDEVEHELNDLLSEVEEEDVQEQGHGDAARPNPRLGCLIM